MAATPTNQTKHMSHKLIINNKKKLLSHKSVLSHD